MDWRRRVLGATELISKAVPSAWLSALYATSERVPAAASVANAVLPSAPVEVVVRGGPLRGVRLVLDLRTEKGIWLGLFEPWVGEALLTHLDDGDEAWDVGGFIGYHALVMHRAGARVTVLEPDPVNRERLLRNLSGAGAGNVDVLPVAAGARPGRVRLVRTPGRQAETRAVADVPSGSDADLCEVVTLDSLLDGRPRPKLVKIDVEGAEDDVLAGATRLLGEVRPALLVELHGRAGEPAARRLEGAGYAIRRLDTPSVRSGDTSQVLATPT